MASFVYYKFKSQRSESRIAFDGTGISVFDLKRDIILANNLGKASEFDLAIYNPQNEEYKDDSTIIPRSSSVLVSRLPPVRPGKGRAAIYVAGVEAKGSSGVSAGPSSSGPASHFKGPSGPMSRRFDGRDDGSASRPSSSTAPTSQASAPTSLKNEETAGIAAMFAQSEQQWEETQEKMQYANRIPFTSTRGGGPQRKAYVPQSLQSAAEPTRQTPLGYVCYRCGQKGHWIQECPTNDNREFDNRPRIKRTTGIPRSFLKSVEAPSEGAVGPGIMITPEGSYVMAQPDAVAWKKQSTRDKTLTEDDIRAKPPTDSSLACPMCSKLYREAVKTPCCGAVYCEECIQTHLLEHDFECPSCHKKVSSLDKLAPERTIRARVQSYINKALGQDEEEEDSPRPANGLPAKVSTNQAAVSSDIYSQDDSSAGFGNQQQTFPEPAQIQARLDQVHAMLRNPSLGHQARMQIQNQLNQLNRELEQANMIHSLAQAALAIEAANAGGGAMNGMPPQGMNHMMPPPMMHGGFGAPMGDPMMNGGMMNGSQFTNQQPAASDSAYQRLPVNNRRRAVKRERPSDFVEVGGDGPASKVARYWE
ncbi:DWNN-domain-containing protein [Auriculariales sp. MPI-PUGE-AT-0066]|nr:DWNN-domain-containing protein [Auriculariales sp. MPI-PUGE-AT-0066]